MQYPDVPRFSRMAIAERVLVLAKRFGYGQQTFFWLLGKAFAEDRKKTAFAGYEPDALDVFALVYPKSGTNWLLQILQQLLASDKRAEFAAPDAYRHIHDVVAWPEAPFSGIAPLHRNQVHGSARRAIKAALRASLVPYSAEAKYVGMIRDPKDVVVSAFHFLPAVFGMQDVVRLEDFVELFLGPDFPGGDWATHTAELWAWRERPNVHVLMYDEVRKDPKGAIAQLADLLEIELPNESLQRILERTDIGYMRAHEDQFAPPRLPLASRQTRAVMVRSGTIGSGTMELSPLQCDRIDTTMHDRLRSLGSDFPYEKYRSTSTE